MNQSLKESLTNFRACVEHAPDGTYTDAKEISDTIGATCDQLIKDIKSLGLKADVCDLIFEVEAKVYDYVKRSNPESNVFMQAEGFGASMDTPARDRVIAQTKRDRDFLGSSPSI